MNSNDLVKDGHSWRAWPGLEFLCIAILAMQQRGWKAERQQWRTISEEKGAEIHWRHTMKKIQIKYRNTMKKYLRGKGSRKTFSPLDFTFQSHLNMNPKFGIELKSTSTGKSEFAFVLKGLQNYLDFCSPCRCSQFAHYCCSNISHFLSSVEEQHETMQFSSSWIMYKYWMKNIPIPYLPKKCGLDWQTTCWGYLTTLKFGTIR